MEDAGAGRADRSLEGTLPLYEDAAVLTHQNTVRKDWRLHQGPQDFYLLCRLLLGIENSRLYLNCFYALCRLFFNCNSNNNIDCNNNRNIVKRLRISILLVKLTA